MMIKREAVTPFDFEGLEIRDYTNDRDGGSSVAEITVPGGARHRRAWSKRSDKYFLHFQPSARNHFSRFATFHDLH